MKFNFIPGIGEGMRECNPSSWINPTATERAQSHIVHVHGELMMVMVLIVIGSASGRRPEAGAVSGQDYYGLRATVARMVYNN